MDDPVVQAKAASDGFIEQAYIECDVEDSRTHAALERLKGYQAGVIDELAKRIGTEYEAGVGRARDHVLGVPRVWLATARPPARPRGSRCLCGTGAGRWSVSQTARALHAKAGTIGYARVPGSAPLVRVTEIEGTNPLARTWAVAVNGADVGTLAVDRFILERDGERAAIRELARYLAEQMWPRAGVRDLDPAELLPTLYPLPGTVRS